MQLIFEEKHEQARKNLSSQVNLLRACEAISLLDGSNFFLRMKCFSENINGMKI